MNGLVQRAGVYYLRKHIPVPVRPAFGGRRDVWVSLKTRDKREAERRFHPAVASLNQRVADAEKALRRDADEAAHMALPAVQVALDRFEEISGGLLTPHRFAPVSRSAEDEDYVGLALRLGTVEALPRSRGDAERLFLKALDQLAHEREEGWSLMVPAADDGEPIPVVPARYLKAVTEFVEAQFETTRRTLEALLVTIKAGAEEAPESGVDALVVPPADAVAVDGLKALAAIWEARKRPAKSSRADMATAIKRFERVNGPLPYKRVTPDHVRAFKNDLVADSTIKSATKQKMWSMVNTAMAVAADDGLLANPFAQVKLGRLPDDASDREVLTAEDLERLFAALSGDEWWLARVGLYSGARLGELCQLDKANVIRRSGALFLDIRADAEAGKTLKTRNSARIVPVHPQLLADGFEAWVAGRPDGGLFGMTSAVASKRLARRFDDLDFEDGKVFHSLRHTFISAARRVMEEEYREWIVGHRSQKVGRQYGSFDLLEVKRRMDKVTFSG